MTRSASVVFGVWFITIGIAANAHAASTCSGVSAEVSRVVTQLTSAGYTVNCGSVEFPANHTTSCSSGGANSPNPSTCYGVYQVPGRTGSAPSPVYELDNDEALVFIGTTPPSSFYFGFQSYVLNRKGSSGKYENVFASVGPAWNQRTIAGQTPRTTPLAQVFSDFVFVLSTANPKTQGDIVSLGLPYYFSATPTAQDLALAQQITNVEQLPSDLIELGRTASSDQLQTLLRLTPFKALIGGQYEFDSASQAYMAAPGATLLRVSPNPPRFNPPDPNLYTVATDPLPPTKVQPGVTWEQQLLGQAGVSNGASALGTIVSNVIANANKNGLVLQSELDPTAGGTFAELLNGRACLAEFASNNSVRCAGDSSDALYVLTGTQSIQYPSGGKIVIVGVNHGTLGSGTYSNVAIDNPGTYAAARTQLAMNGSAKPFLGTAIPASAADDFYVATIEASCPLTSFACMTAPAGTGLSVIERNYLAPLTGTKPDATDVFLPYVLIFAPGP